MNNTEELTYYKGLCRKLSTEVLQIFGMLYVPSRNKQAMLDKIYKIAGEGYDLTEEATKKGLWK